MSKSILDRLDDLEKVLHANDDIDEVKRILAAVRKAAVDGVPDERGIVTVTV